MKNSTTPQAAADHIRQRVPHWVAPRVALVLGSGLGGLTDHMQNAVVIPYHEIPGFQACNVVGHKGNFVVGTLQDVPVITLQGRYHLYEGIDYSDIQLMIRTLKVLGCEILFQTNAAGSTHIELPLGRLMLITDHINFQFHNPMVGPNDEDFGPRFPSMQDAYDPELRTRLLASAKKLGIELTEGVYLGTLGPHYETAAEIRAFRLLGGDAVGMSTVPETLVARHCGLRVAGVSAITNMATGILKENHDHEAVLQAAADATQNLARLILEFLASA